MQNDVYGMGGVMAFRDVKGPYTSESMRYHLCLGTSDQ